MGFGLFRGQSRSIALTVLALSVLGDLGAATLLQQAGPRLARFGVALPILAAANLLFVNWDNNWLTTQPFTPSMERSPYILTALIDGAPTRAGAFVLDGGVAAFAPNEAFRHGLESMSGYLHFQLKGTYDLLHTDAYWRQFQLFNVRHIVAQRELRGAASLKFLALATGCSVSTK